MNILSELPKIVQGKKKRRGRGLSSGSGAKSGHGTKRHQSAREKIPLHFEGGQNRLVKKFPLQRGKSRNKSVQEKPILVTLTMLEQLEKDSVVNVRTLVEKKVISDVSKYQRVKIVANGKITKPLTIELPVSKSAQTKIEKAGGKVT